jgi:hypothetical protein
MTVPNLSFQEMEKEVFAFFNEAVAQEINIVNLQNEKGHDAIPLRAQLILIFSLVDILSNYWFEFRGESASQRIRFCSWISEFCMTKKNSKYIGYWKTVSAQRLYELRCSSVHFLGLSRANEGIYFALSPNDYPESKRGEFSRKISKPGNKTIMLKPRHLHELTRQGGMLMLNSWQRMIKQANKGSQEKREEYMSGIERVWRKYFSEGAVNVKLGPRET